MSDTTVIGPECFTDGEVICYKGENFVRQQNGQEEVRIVNKETGGEKGRKPTRFDLIPIEPLRALAEHFGEGAKKYDDRNWERGYEWGLSYASLVNHLTLWWGGEDNDEETGSNHLTAVAWHAFALLEFSRTHPEMDNRP